MVCEQRVVGSGASDEQLRALAAWWRAAGRPVAALDAIAPRELRRMGANPIANGGRVFDDLSLPGWPTHALSMPRPEVAEWMWTD